MTSHTRFNFSTLILSCIVSLLISCDTGPSLQRYFVTKTEDAQFLVVNVPIPMEDFYESDLNPSEQKTLNSIKKLNVLMLSNHNIPTALIEDEIGLLQEIFAQPKYNKLSDFGYLKSKASLYYTGNERKVDEGILYLRNKEKGLVVVRILGNNMNPGALMMLTNRINKSKLVDELGKQVAPLFESLSEEVKTEKQKSI